MKFVAHTIVMLKFITMGNNRFAYNSLDNARKSLGKSVAGCRPRHISPGLDFDAKQLIAHIIFMLKFIAHNVLQVQTGKYLHEK